MYIDTGTFWAFIIGLGVAIGVIYYTLDKRITNPNTDYKKDLDDAIKRLAKATAADLDDIRTKHENDIVAIYGRLFAPEDIKNMVEEILNEQHGSNKKRLNEISELYARVENLETKTSIKPPKVKVSPSGVGVIVKG